jgi:hypothetical protein
LFGVLEACEWIGKRWRDKLKKWTRQQGTSYENGPKSGKARFWDGPESWERSFQICQTVKAYPYASWSHFSHVWWWHISVTVLVPKSFVCLGTTVANTPPISTQLVCIQEWKLPCHVFIPYFILLIIHIHIHTYIHTYI